jgi:hypothetical protein
MIVGILGRKGSGKDTVGDYLVSNKNFMKYSFANHLKYGMMEVFGFSKEQVFGNLKEEVDEYWGVTPREVLQIIGTDVFQFDLPNKYFPNKINFDRSFWVKRFLKDYHKFENKNIVICDVRFQHEVDALTNDMNARIIKIERPSINAMDAHLSENEIDSIKNYTDIIFNDGTIKDLHDKVDKILF